MRATLGSPFPDRPGEGSLRCSAEVSPAAAASLSRSGSGQATLASLADQYTRLLERSISHPRAVDLEQLCVSPGRAAWSVRVDACLVDAGRRGGASAASSAVLLAAVAALRSFRRPDAAVEQIDTLLPLENKGGGGEEGVDVDVDSRRLSSSRVVVHSALERPSVPLALRLTPVAVAFTFMWSGGGRGSSDKTMATTLVLDPDAAEEAAASLRGYGCGATSTSAASGLLVSAGAPSGDVLFLDRGAPGSGGAAPVRGPNGISSAMLAARVSSAAALDISKELERALKDHEVAVKAARVRRHVEKGSSGVGIGVGARVGGVDGSAKSSSASRSVAAVGALDAAAAAFAAPAAPTGLPTAAQPDPVSASKKNESRSEAEREEEEAAAVEVKSEQEVDDEEADKAEEERGAAAREESEGAAAAAAAAAPSLPASSSEQQNAGKKEKKKSGGKSPSWRSDELRARAGKRSKGGGSGGGSGGEGDTLEQIAAMIGAGASAGGGSKRPSLAAAATRKKKAGKK